MGNVPGSGLDDRGRLAPGSAVWSRPPATVQEVLERARELRPLIAARSPEIDAAGQDPAEIMALLAAAGLQAINVPAEFGGLATGPTWSGWADTLEAYMELAAADGSVGQLWGYGSVLVRSVLSEGTLPADTRAELAHEILHEGRRLANLMSERGASAPTVARRVDGGIVFNGTKSFASNTEGAGRDIAVVSMALVDGDSAQARPHRAGPPRLPRG